MQTLDVYHFWSAELPQKHSVTTFILVVIIAVSVQSPSFRVVLKLVTCAQ